MIQGLVYGGIAVKPGSVCFLFGPRNPLVGYMVKPSSIDDGLGLGLY